MSYLLGTLLAKNKPVRVALTQIYGIGRKKGAQVCQQLGLSDNIRVSELTSFEIEKIARVISQNYLVDSELRSEVANDKKRLMSIGCHRGRQHAAKQKS